NIGKLVVISVVMAIVFYVVVIGMTSVAIPADQLGSHDLVTADALTTMFGSTDWGKLVIAGGLAGIITSWNAFLMGSSRLMWAMANRSEEHTSELQSRFDLVCRLLLEKKKD